MRIGRLVCGGAAVLAALAAPAAAAAAAAASAGTPAAVARGTVAAVVDGDTFRLAGGPDVRLTGIQAPKLPLGRANFRPWPLAEESKAALAALVAGREVRLGYPGRRVDRWGRLLARVEAGGVWVQREMVARGLARVYTFADNRAGAAELYAAERDARAARRGIWDHPFYRIVAAGDAGRLIGTFQLVEGTVRAAAVVRGRGYLNFGDDWRTDFTISIAPRDLPLFRAARIDIGSFEGRRVRVRGWLIGNNGPMINVTHPEQIERLAE